MEGDLIKRLYKKSQRGQTPNRGQLMVPKRVRFDQPQVGEPDPCDADAAQEGTQMRRMQITESMLQKYGCAEGCEGCWTEAAGMTQNSHGEACRKRIEQALDGDEAGRELRRKNTERENQRSRKRWRGI